MFAFIILFKHLLFQPLISLCAASPSSLKPGSGRIPLPTHSQTGRQRWWWWKQRWRRWQQAFGSRIRGIPVGIRSGDRSRSRYGVWFRFSSAISPSHPLPPPFLVANPSRNGRQHPRPIPSTGRHFCLSRLLILPFRPLFHLVWVILFLSNELESDDHPTSIPLRHPTPPPNPLLRLLFLCVLATLPHPLTISLPRLPHTIQRTITLPPRYAMSFVDTRTGGQGQGGRGPGVW